MPENLAVIYPKIETKRPILRVFLIKDANGIANSEDPDQTALLRSILIWVCTVCPDLSVQKLRIITVARVLKWCILVIFLKQIKTYRRRNKNSLCFCSYPKNKRANFFSSHHEKGNQSLPFPSVTCQAEEEKETETRNKSF